MPSGRICKNINALTDHKEPGYVKLGGRIGGLSPSHCATWFMGELVGLGFFDAGLFGATWSTFAFGLGRRSAMCRDAFRRTRTATIIPPRIALEKVMF